MDYGNMAVDMCALFEVPLPKAIDFKARRRNACYASGSKTIRISGRYNEVEKKQALVHEMAHHVDFTLNPNRRNRRNHDEMFFKILCDLVELCYDQISDYAWHREYATIYRWACMKGYAKRGLGWDGQPKQRPTLRALVAAMKKAEVA